jgi:hypothetical protein
VRKVLRGTPDLVAIDDSVTADGSKTMLHVLQNKAALLDVAQSDIVEVVRMGLAGEDVTPVHNTESKFEIPVRLTLPAEKQSSLDALLKLRVRSRDGPPGAGLRTRRGARAAREKVIYHKDLLPVVYVVADMGGKLDSPLYGMFAARGDSSAVRSTVSSKRRHARRVVHPPAGRPRRRLQHQVGRRVAGHLRNLPRHGHRLRVGLILIYLLVVAHFKSYLVPLIIMAPIPLTIIGVMPGHALLGSQYTATSMIGMIALAGIIVRNSILLVDFIRQQVGEGCPSRSDHPVRRRARQADRADRAGGDARRAVHSRRPDLQRAGDQPDLRHLRFHPAHAGGHPGALLRRVQKGVSDMTTDRAVRIMAGSFILISLALGCAREPAVRLEVLPVVHRLRRRQPVAERLHLLLPGREPHGQAGDEAPRQTGHRRQGATHAKTYAMAHRQQHVRAGGGGDKKYGDDEQQPGIQMHALLLAMAQEAV